MGFEVSVNGICDAVQACNCGSTCCNCCGSTGFFGEEIQVPEKKIFLPPYIEKPDPTLLGSKLIRVGKKQYNLNIKKKPPKPQFPYKIF